MLMKGIFKYILPLFAFALALSVSSCTGDDADDDYLSFKGSPSFKFPSYMLPGQKIEVSPSSVTKLDGSEEVGFYWKDNITNKADTIRAEHDPAGKTADFVYIVPDTLTTITLYVYAFANGYYQTNSYREATVLREGFNTGSIKNFDLHESDITLTDSRDSRKYLTTKIGNTYWMRQNLAYDGCGVPYDNEPMMNNFFGRYYTWEEAVTACPEGWELPSEEDWIDLAKASGLEDPQEFAIFPGIAGKNMVNATFNGKILWEFWPQVKITDETHFAALPTGYGENNGESFVFHDFYSYAGFWTSTEFGSDAVFRYFFVESDDIFAGHAGKNGIAMSVRCIKK